MVIVSSASFINAQTAINANSIIITAFCKDLSTNTGLQSTIVKKLNSLSTNSEFTQNFPNTFAYVTLAQNQNNLIGTVSQCQSFFTGLQAAIQSDLASNGIPVSQLEQQFNQFYATYFASIANSG